MLSCCKSNGNNPAKQNRPQTPKPQYKYSFKQRSHIFVGSQETSPEHRYAFDDYQLSTSRSDEALLNRQYELLQKQQQELTFFIENKVRPLENEVVFYERQVKAR